MPESLDALISQLHAFPLVAGLVFLLLGWLLYWGSVHLLGALIVGGIGLVVAEGIGLLIKDVEPMILTILRAGGVVVGVAIGLLVARLMHHLAFFTFGWLLGAMGFFKGYLVVVKHFGWETNDILLAFGTPVAGLLLGVLAVKFDRWLSIIATSLVGAFLVSAGIDDWQAPFVIPIVCACGIFIQSVICSAGESRRKRGRE